MLVIKKAQIETFIAEDDTQLETVITEIVSEAFHEGVSEYPEDRLRSMVRIGIDKAKARGFESAADIAAFVAIMFEISPNFDTVEPIDQVLNDESIQEESRIEQLLGRIQDESWAEAEETYDKMTWFPDAPAAE